MHDADDGLDSEGTRRCRDCRIDKPADRFARDKTKRGGRSSQCKECAYIYNRAWKARHPEKVKEYGARVQARHGERYKAEALARYAVDGAARKREYNARNRDRVRAASKRCYAAHREAYRVISRRNYRKNPARTKQQARAWQKANRKKFSAIMVIQNAKRRSRKMGNGGRGFTPAHWRALLVRVGGVCAYCRDNKADSIDHFVPLVKGGQHDFANLVPACRRCNTLKRQHDPQPWVVARFGEERLRYVESIMFA